MTAQPKRRGAAVLAVAAFSLAGLPGVAWSQQSEAPPGNSGVQEYVETIPDGSGKRATNNAGHAVKLALPKSGVVGAATRRELAALDDDGFRAAALAEATAPSLARGASRVGDADGGSLLNGVLRTASGGAQSGMGIFLPLLMLAGLVGAAGYALGRRQA